MAIARDASSPADIALATSANDDPAGTTASFTPPVDSIITVAIACDSVSGVTPGATISNTGFSISPAWGSALVNSRGDTEGTAGIVLIYRTRVTSSAAGTITVTVNNMGASGTATRGRAYVDVWTGADADQSTAAIGENSFTTNTYTGTTVTTTRAGSQVVVSYGDWNATGSAAPTTGQSGTGFFISGTYAGIRTYQTTPVVSSATAVAGAFDANGTGATDVNWVAVEILAAAGASGAIAGTIALTLTPTGTMTGAGALAGTVALSLTPTGTLSGAGALAGSVALAIAPTGTLTGAGALAGNIQLAIAPTGTLIGAGTLAGSISLAFSVAGAFDQGGMLGDVPLALTVSGALTGSGALAGTVPLAFDLTGDLTAFDSGAIDGSIALSLDVSGAMIGAGALTGSIDIDLGVSGSLGGSGGETPSGGFFMDFEGYARRRAQEKRKREEDEAAALQATDETDREIAALLHAQAAREAEEGDLERLRTMVAQYADREAEIAHNERIAKAFSRAAEKGGVSALLALEREVQRQFEEEEFLILMMLAT